MFLKSTRPRPSDSSGMMMSVTIELTILPNAAPMMTPTAKSKRVPLIDEGFEFLEHRSPWTATAVA